MLKTTNLELSYRDGSGMQPVFSGINLELPARGLTAIVGPSGSGKSSLLYVLAGLRQPTGGSVELDGQSYASLGPKGLERLRRQRYGFVFQQHFLVPYMTVLQNVLVGAPRPDPSYIARAKELLGQLGLEQYRDRVPTALSGGERQRVALARALVNNPILLFADEPTASLDQDRAQQVMELLRSFASQCAVVLVTHDLSLLGPGERVCELRNGSLSDGGERPGSQRPESGRLSSVQSL